MEKQMSKQKQIKSTVIKCVGNNQAFQVCTNEKCKRKLVFTCGISKCKCHEEHAQCIKTNILYIVGIIKQKIHKTVQFQTYVNKTFTSIIDQISDYREILQVKIQNQMKYTQLYQVQRNFLMIMESNQNPQNFTSYDSALLWKIVNRKFDFKTNVFQESKVAIEKYQAQSKALVTKISTQIDQLTKKQILPVVGLTNYEKNISKQLLQKSSICKDSQYAQRLIKFFPRRLKKMELIFKASEHNFNIAKYFQICGLVPNTVFLCQTNKDKILGAYSPLCLSNTTGSSQWGTDNNFESFIFSLTNNDRFDLKTAAYAIYRTSDKSYFKYGNDLLIYNNSNTNNSCNLNINNSNYYFNSKYKNSDKQSYLRFNGYQTYNGTTTKQYQIWKVQFCE